MSKDRVIITISGKIGTGKSGISMMIADMFKKNKVPVSNCVEDLTLFEKSNFDVDKFINALKENDINIEIYTQQLRR